MLFKQTVEPATFSLLKELIQLPSLQDFYLVGGTALALQIGHRKSIDLDLFTDSEYDQDLILSEFEWDYEEFGRSKIFLGVRIQGIKVDIVKYLFPCINPLVVEEGIPMANREEIAGMKLWAIARRGTKKDFIDIYFLMKEFSLQEMIDFFQRKFPNIGPLLILRSMTYFEDADLDPDPDMLVEISWEEIKESIRVQVSSFLGT